MTQIVPAPLGVFSSAALPETAPASVQLAADGLFDAYGLIKRLSTDVTGRGHFTADFDVMQSILVELRVMNQVLSQTQGLNEELDPKRADEQQALGLDLQ